MKYIIAAVVGLFLFAMAGPASATPMSGATCAQCHRSSTGHMAAAGFLGTKDLGTKRLDGKRPGALKLYTVARGGTVSIQVKVTNGASLYDVEVSNLSKGGLLNKSTNKLVYKADPTWVKVGSYFIKSAGGMGWGGTAKTYAFKLTVNAKTPVDVYEITLTTAGIGGGMWTQSQKVYLQVK